MVQTSHSILTVGSLAFDSIQTPSGKVDSVLGGSVNYFSIAASFYTPVEVVGVVGQDFPEAHLEWLASRKIGVSGIQRVPGKTFHWVGSYDHQMCEAKTLSTALNVFEHFDPQLSEVHRQSSTLFLGNIDPELQTRVLDQVSSPTLVACDSMNFWITGKPDQLKNTLKRVDILSINQAEALLLSEQTHILAAAEVIQKMGPSVVIIKRGEYGAMLFTRKRLFIAPAYPVAHVVDPTGAGDSFAGALMGFLTGAQAHRDLSESNPEKWEELLRKAVVSGCVMASFTVEDFSFRRLMKLQISELMARQKELIRMISL